MSFNSKTLDGAFDIEADNLIVNESSDLKGSNLIEGPSLFQRGIRLESSVTSNIMTLSAINVNTDYLLALPPDIGIAGQILATNGSGDSFWLDPPSTGGSVSFIGIATVPPFLFVNGLSTDGTYTSKTFTLSMTTITTDYGGTGLSTVGMANQVLTSNGTTLYWSTPTVGTVTSVDASVPSFLSISGNPITSSGTLAISLSGGALPTTSGGTGLTSVGTTNQVLTSNGTYLYWTTPTTGTVTSVTASSPLASTGGANPNISLSSYTGLGPVVLQSLPTISSIKQYLNTVSSEAFSISGVYNYPAPFTLSATADSIQLNTCSITQDNNANFTGNIYLNAGAFKENVIIYMEGTTPRVYTSYQATAPLDPLKDISISRLLNNSGKLAIQIQNPDTYNYSFFTLEDSGAYNGNTGGITGHDSTSFFTDVNYTTPSSPLTILTLVDGVPDQYPTQYTGGVIISSVLDTSISTLNDMVLTSDRTFIQANNILIDTIGDNNKFRVDTKNFDIFAAGYNFYTPAVVIGAVNGGIDSYIAGTIAWNAFGDFEATTGGAADIKAFANAKVYGGGYINIHCKPIELPLFHIPLSSPPFCSGDIDIRTTATWYTFPPVLGITTKFQPGSVKLTSNTGGGVDIHGYTGGINIKSTYEYALYVNTVELPLVYVGTPPLLNAGINLDTGGADLTITTVNPSPGGLGAQDIGNITINSVNMYLSKQTGMSVGPSDTRISGEFAVNTKIRFPAELYADSAGAGVNGAWLTVSGADWKNHYAGGTCSLWSAVNFGAARVVSSNPVTYEKAINVYIDQPVSAGSSTFTADYALYVNGTSFFLDTVNLGGNLVLPTGGISLGSGNIIMTSGHLTTNLLGSSNIIAASTYLSSITNTSMATYTTTAAFEQTYIVANGILTFPIGSIVICSGFTPSILNGTFTVTGGTYTTITTNNTAGPLNIATVQGAVQSYDSSVEALELYTPNCNLTRLRIGREFTSSFSIAYDVISSSLLLRPENATTTTLSIKRYTEVSTSTTSGAVVVTGDTGISGNLFAGGINLPSLTASNALALDSTRNIISISNTGTGNNVLNTNPIITGPTLSGTVNVSGLTVSKPVFTDLSNNLVSANTTGAGSVVLAATPTLSTSFKVQGSTTGIVTFTVPPSFTDYNINWSSGPGTSGQVLTSGGGGATMMTWTTPTTGTVTNFTVASVPAFLAASVATSTTTPALTLSLSGTALPTANGGTGLTTVGSAGTILTSNGTTLSWASPATSGTVTSVAASVPSFLSITGSPITGAGTLAISYNTGTALPTDNGGTGLTSVGSAGTILTSNGTTLSWVAPATSGTVTSVTATSPLFSTGGTTPVISCTTIGSGTTFVLSTSPTLTTPILGIASATSITLSAQALQVLTFTGGNLRPAFIGCEYTGTSFGSSLSFGVNLNGTTGGGTYNISQQGGRYHIQSDNNLHEWTGKITGSNTESVIMTLSPVGNLIVYGSTTLSTTLSVTGSTSHSGDLTLLNSNNGAGLTFGSRNSNSGSSAFTSFYLQNDTANSLVLFINSSTKTTNGGVNTATIRNDAGTLILACSGSTANIALFSTTAQVTGNLTVSGSTSLSGNLTLLTSNNGAGLTFGSRNSNSGSSAYTLFYLQNDTSFAVSLFINSSTRSFDGGVNTATLRNDAGTLILSCSSSASIALFSTTVQVTGDLVVSGVIRSTVNTGRYTMTGNFAWPNNSNTVCGNWTTAATVGDAMTLTSGNTWVNNLGRSIAVVVCYTGRRNATNLGVTSIWIEANSVTWSKSLVSGTDNISISAVVTLNNSNGFVIRGFHLAGVGDDFNASDSLLTLTIL